MLYHIVIAPYYSALLSIFFYQLLSPWWHLLTAEHYRLIIANLWICKLIAQILCGIKILYLYKNLKLSPNQSEIEANTLEY